MAYTLTLLNVARYYNTYPVQSGVESVETSLIVTFIGDDRPGIVEQLAEVVEAQGGNWLESQLSQLGGKFAGLVLVDCPGDSPSTCAEQLHSALQAKMGALCSITVTASGEPSQPAPGRDVSLNVMGPDRQGIVREVSHALAQRGINVLRLNSDVVSAPMSAELLFKATINARIPQDAEFDQLAQKLDEIANQMTLDIDWE